MAIVAAYVTAQQTGLQPEAAWTSAPAQPLQGGAAGTNAVFQRRSGRFSQLYVFNSVGRQGKDESVGADAKVPGFIDTSVIMPQSVADKGVADATPGSTQGARFGSMKQFNEQQYQPAG